MTERDGLALRDYLMHMHQGIIRILNYVSDIDQNDFFTNEEKQDAVIRNLEVIGEAAGNIQRHFPDFGQKYPTFPLKAAYGTRNALAHGYFKIDLNIVWKTIQRDIPILRRQIEEILETSGNRTV